MEFIEVFSGTANLSFVIVHSGIRAFVFDVQDGDDGDILRAEVRRHIYRLLRHPQCAGIWFGMPCRTFSRGDVREEQALQHCAETSAACDVGCLSSPRRTLRKLLWRMSFFVS